MINCDDGKYCNKELLSAVSGTCDGGYYCRGGTITYTDGVPITVKTGAKSPRPLRELRITQLQELDAEGFAKIEGDVCPRGHYCVPGVDKPVKCAKGKYLPYRGAKAGSECIDCWPGYLCEKDGMSVPVTECPAGFYCPRGTAEAGNAT